MRDGSFYAVGRSVRKRPLERPIGDGRVAISMGFPVLEVNECVDDAEAWAVKIAELLEADRKRHLASSEHARNGGRARAAKLSPERRREIAQAAARVRWAKP